jgi:type III pantothenate kinase
MNTDWVLALDFGNTRIKAAWFDRSGAIQERILIPSDSEDQMLHQLLQKGFYRCLYCSTRNLPEALEVALEAAGAVRLTHQCILPFQIAYETPQTLGSDRLAAVAGAWHLSPQSNCLVIDAGTCITYDIIRADGVYEGGCISPGMTMRLQAMHHFTARLPLVHPDEDWALFGKSTEEAIRRGGQTGFLAELDGFIRLFQNNFGALHIYITGGDAAYAIRHLKTDVLYDPDLVLKGLFKISICQ